MRTQTRVSGAIDPAAASGSTPARMISAACRNSISTAWTSDSTIAITPNTRTTAGAAPPPRVSSRVSRWVNWPPVEACRTHADQASPALSSTVAVARPRVLAAARASSPPVTSMSGLARRVSAIRAPAAMTPATATAVVTGSSQCCIALTAGSPDKLGEGIRSHQVAVLVTIHVTPSVTAWAIPLSTSPAALLAADLMRLPATQAGSVSGSQGMTHLWFGKAV